MRKYLAKLVVPLLLCVCVVFISIPASAEGYEDLSEGTYEVSASLSCYVNAMGGVEFGAPLLTSSEITVDSDGNAFVTIYLTKSSVTIYSITCDTFIDAAPGADDDNSKSSGESGIVNGTIGIFDEDGNLATDTVTYTLSDDTALNTRSEEVSFVDSITFPLSYQADVYELTLYVNSNVMGVQFGVESSSGAVYPAELTIDWSTVGSVSAGTSTESISSEEIVSGEESDTGSEVTSSADETVVSSDGLSIHYVNGADSDDTDAAVQTVGTTDTVVHAYYNNTAFIIASCVAAACIILGAALIVLAHFLGRRNSDTFTA